MAGSQQKRNRWLYLVLLLMLVVFLGFWTLPLITAVLQENQFVGRTTAESSLNLSQEKQTELETEAKGYQLVLQREPGNATALRGLVEVRLQQGDLQGAIESLEKLAQLNPQQTDYLVLVAQAKQQVGDYEGAAQAYKTILASKPGDINALQGMVNLFLAQNRPEAAIGLLQDALKTATQAENVNGASTVDPTALELLLGQVYASQQRYAEAIAVYDRAIEENEDDFRPVLAKALVLQQQGKIQEAKALFTTAISLAPSKYKDQIKQMATNSPDLETQTEPLEAETEVQ
ncbi:MAG: tetratricopeptide repeat protein [Oscillatoria sp. PMC 1051.18]|nr:tetratricopeptide repeat protein [Oscillatoria sp. PMC 1050.18]MEC5028878.1 tetratricopeptide repeat protein [Oscillatoria sp. PMC 1051.18]